MSHDHELRVVLDGEMPEDEPQEFTFNCGFCGRNKFDPESEEGKALLEEIDAEIERSKNVRN